MTQHPHLDPGPFFLQGGPVGVLLLHGFTGAPPEMRLLGDYLHAQGYTVAAPLLPGHGTSPADLNTRRWTDWMDHAEDALGELRERSRMVFVGGLSLGALITLYLAAQHPDLPGVMAYSPAVFPGDRRIYLTPLMKHFIRANPVTGPSDLTDAGADSHLWSYAETPVSAAHELLRAMGAVRGLLPQVTCPLLVMYSTGDRSIRADAGRYTYQHVGSADKELVALHHSGHCITVDSEWREVAAKTVAFIGAHSKIKVNGGAG
jgi:carboxylesterase